jgi:hypothetical protein
MYFPLADQPTAGFAIARWLACKFYEDYTTGNDRTPKTLMPRQV